MWKERPDKQLQFGNQSTLAGGLSDGLSFSPNTSWQEFLVQQQVANGALTA
jgi:hypothetical protein